MTKTIVSRPIIFRAAQVVLVVKNLPTTAGDIRDMSSIPGFGRSPGVGNGNPLQCFCLENSMDRRAWRATVHGVAKSRTHVHRHAQLIMLLTLLF